MSTGVGVVIAVVAVALIFDFFNGLQDGCNAVATVIYTKALKPQVAIALSALFNFIGPLVVGVAVAKTVGGVISHEVATAHVVIAAMLGATVWEILTWIWALPVSCSHALVGGLLGAGIAALGLDGINWTKVTLVFVALLTSPIVGIGAGFVMMRASRWVLSKMRLSMDRADKFYRRAQIVSCMWVSFSHGANDATKVMGIIGVFLAARAGMTIEEYDIPIWVILACAAAMAAGTYVSVLSFRLIRTMGEKITKLHPINGFSAEVGGAVVITAASSLGMPVSTTHVITAAVAGTGLGSKMGGVSWKVMRAIMLAWVVTLPSCAAMAVGFYYLLGIWM